MFFTRKIPQLILLLFVLSAAPAISVAQQGAVVADNELAVKAGNEILKNGGNAVDAAVATAFVLAVVDQSASGLGGGGFMVMYQAKEKKAHALDFRETAPAAANREQYVKNGKPVPSLSLTGALAVAVPGEVAGLAEAQKRFGTMSLQAVMAPAIQIAVEGFTPQVRLRYALDRQLQNIRKNPDLARVLLSKEEIPSELIRQRELAESLKAIADQGPKVFYEGWIGQAISERIKEEGGAAAPGDLKKLKAGLARADHRPLPQMDGADNAAAELGWHRRDRVPECPRALQARLDAAQFRCVFSSPRRELETRLRRPRTVSRRSRFRPGADRQAHLQGLCRLGAQ